MSSLIVEVCAVEDVLDHPNADKLDIICVKGWKCIVQKGSCDIGDLVVYAPIDSLIPVELSDTMGVTQYLGKEGRVRTTKLRGEYSQGLIIPMQYLPEFKNGRWLPGDDVADVLGIKKYEPPLKRGGWYLRLPDHPDFHRYADIENYNNFPDLLKEGEMVVITEKIYGTNFRAMNVRDTRGKFETNFLVGSHNLNLREDKRDLYWNAARLYDLENILPTGVEIFGEIYGKGVQKLQYDQVGINVAFFDAIQNGRYMNHSEFVEFCLYNNLPTVPVLRVDPWSRDLLDLAEGKSTIAGHIREGIVIKPTFERYDELVGRVILKRISQKYLLKDYGDDH